MYFIIEKEWEDTEKGLLYVPKGIMIDQLSDGREVIPIFLSREKALIYLAYKDPKAKFKLVSKNDDMMKAMFKKMGSNDCNFDINFGFCIGLKLKHRKTKFLKYFGKDSDAEMGAVFIGKHIVTGKDLSHRHKKIINSIYEEFPDLKKEVLSENNKEYKEMAESANRILKEYGFNNQLNLSIANLTEDEKTNFKKEMENFRKKLHSEVRERCEMYVLYAGLDNICAMDNRIIFFKNKLEANIINLMFGSQYKIVNVKDIDKRFRRLMSLKIGKNKTTSHLIILGFFRANSRMPSWVFNDSKFPSSLTDDIGEDEIENGYPYAELLSNLPINKMQEAHDIIMQTVNTNIASDDILISTATDTLSNMRANNILYKEKDYNAGLYYPSHIAING